MRTLSTALLLIMLLIGGSIAGYKLAYPTYTYRYRMTVEVAADGKIHSGSGVIEVTVRKQPEFGQAPPQVSYVHGEAVFVDLGQERNVIALLAAGPRGEDVDYSYNIVPTLFSLTFDDQDLAKLSTLRGGVEVPSDHLPTFVTFTDLNDPKTARIVRPNEFPQVFGPNVRFVGERIEMTSDPVTRTIEGTLPWLPHPRYLSGQFACNPAKALCLHGGHFEWN
jgi:hypothetical protein